MVVNATTWEFSPFKDPSCVVNAGDHEFFHHKSFIYYGGVKQLTVSKLALLFFRAKPDASPELLARITRGAAISVQFPRGYRRLLIDQRIIDPPESP